MSKYLINKIVAQDERYEINPKRERDIHNQINKEKETRNNELLDILRTEMTKEEMRCNDVA